MPSDNRPPYIPHLACHLKSRSWFWTAPLLLCVLSAARLSADEPKAVAPDAVIELWEQHWTLNADGSTVYRLKQHVRLNADRAYGDYADPRITYNVDTDDLQIIAAHVKMVDGTYRELPDYSHVFVSPSVTSGWPAFAAIRQHLLCLSGIEPGCVAELEYQITSKPGAKPYLAADVRLDDHYSVQKRVVSVTLPATAKATPSVFNLPQSAYKATTRDERGLHVQEWTFAPLPAVTDEPQSAPWQTRCARFAFSTAGTADQWLAAELNQLNDAANESEPITKLSAEWTKDLFQPAEKMRALQDKLAASFNFVQFDPTWRPAALRRASTTMMASYGTPEEAAALLLSLFTSAGIPAQLGVLTNDDSWTDAAPQKSLVAAYVVVPVAGASAAQPEIWDPHHGRIDRDAHWAGHTLRWLNGTTVKSAALPVWTDADESRCNIGGTITLKDDGSLTGTLSLRTTGLFVSFAGLRSESDQKSRVNNLIHRVLPDVDTESFTVKTLAPGEFAVEAKVKSSKPLKKIAGGYWVKLADDSPFLASVPLPLSHTQRELPVRLTGPFDELINLNIEWPKGWTVAAQPQSAPSAECAAGIVEQRATLGENRLTLERHTRIAQRDLAPADFLALRGPLNELHSDAARTLMLKP